MSEDAWVTAAKANYDDDTNLAARQAVFGYLLDSDPVPPPLSDFSTVAGQRVLDVGCGNGLFLGAAGAHADQIVGVDLSAGMLEACAAGQSGSEFTANLVQADALHLPVVDGWADVTLALWMLYHMTDLPGAVQELRRVTAEDGYLVASTNTNQRSFLHHLVGDALEAVLGRPVASWAPRLSFSAENGEEILRSSFAEVTTHVAGDRFRFTDAEIIVRYVGSMLGPIKAENGNFNDLALLTEVGNRAVAQLEANGHMDLAQTRAVFICR